MFITSYCTECKCKGYQTDDTGAYWQCHNGHRWADISWIGYEEDYMFKSGDVSVAVTFVKE